MQKRLISLLPRYKTSIYFSLVFLFIFFSNLSLVSQNQYFSSVKQQKWVDSTLASLSLEEKIGQLFMIRAYSNKDVEFETAVKSNIEQYKIGGICFFQGSPQRQLNLAKDYQSASKLPLFIAIDGEWGVGMRLDSVIKFPKQMTLGATCDTNLIYQIGKAIGNQCNEVGVNVNFAPVVDVNSNAANPVINYRSFGENPEKVATYAWMLAKGMQDEGVMACAKHFPGHGDTHSDSHHTLPSVDSDFETLRKTHIYPFKLLANKGIQSVMVAHLSVPALDTTQATATSLSSVVVNGYLFDSLNFKGLAFTDALEMKGVSNYFSQNQISLMAFLAGNDILLMPHNLDSAISSIKMAIDSGLVPISYLDAKVRKILMAKMPLLDSQVIDSTNILEALNSKKNIALINLAFEKSLILIKNNQNILPIKTDTNAIAVVSIGEADSNEFSTEVGTFSETVTFSISTKSSTKEFEDLAIKLKSFEKVVIGYLNPKLSSSANYGLNNSVIDFIEKVAHQSKVILVLNANPYAASFFTESKVKAILIGHEDNEFTRIATARAIFGNISIGGKLPVTISSDFKEGFGLKTQAKILYHSTPEMAGFQTANLKRIDSIIQDGLKAGAYPGARVLIARNGKIFYDKSFGFFTYDEKVKVTRSTIYDLASITKAMATTLAIMRLVDEGKIDIDRKLVYYLPELKGTNKANLEIRDILAHQAGLQPGVSLSFDFKKSGKIDTTLLSSKRKEGFRYRLNKDYYISDNLRDSVLNRINQSSLTNKRYLYSDLGMYYLQAIIEKISGTTLDIFVDSVFYKPMNINSMTYRPLEKFASNSIAPTEIDNGIRNGILQGYVHDPGAAFVGGVAGHAGLFSTAGDLAVLCQMLLWQGNYGNRPFLSPEVIEEFTRQQFPLDNNRRGLGFDKPLPLHQKGGPSCHQASSASFGHSGFTGTLFWVDPEYDLIYIFLSNRVYPTSDNRKLLNMSIRTKIQEEIYRQMGVF